VKNLDSAVERKDYVDDLLQRWEKACPDLQ
jgi:hypothetical protein